MRKPFLPYNRQSIDQSDIDAVLAVFDGDWLTTGPSVAGFETDLAVRTGAKHACVCANGTAALHLAMLALGIGPGDAVVVPSVTFLASANAVRLAGGEVVFADVDPDTGLLTVDTLRAAIERVGAGQRLRAVVPVHLNGQCCDMPAIAAVARENGLHIVEDAAHALGAEYRLGEAHRPVGDCAYSDMTICSFHPVKSITCGEGGAVLTNDAELAAALALYRNHGMERDPARLRCQDAAHDENGRLKPWYYEMQALGLNYRITDLQCALGTSQLAKLERFMVRRRELADHYDRALAPLADVLRPVPRVKDVRSAWHIYAVLIDFDAIGLNRTELMTRLREAGIGTQVHYIPVHSQPYYRDRYGDIDLPGCDAYYRRVLSLPMYVDLEVSDIKRIVGVLGEIIASP